MQLSWIDTPTCVKIRGRVVSVSFIFPHPPEDEKKRKEVKVRKFKAR